MIAHLALQLLLLTPSSSGPAQDPPAFDACALYPLEEFSGFAKDQGRRHRTTPRSFNGVSTSTCWHGTQYDSLHLKIIVQRGRTKEDLKLGLTALKKIAGGATGKPAPNIPGLGDEAFWGQIGPSNGQLHIVIGTDLLTIQTWGKGTGAGTLPKTLELARVIVERFKKQR